MTLSPPVCGCFHRFIFVLIYFSLDFYLLEPPEGAEHGPVDPSLIILAGDSAGGNITLALLCVPFPIPELNTNIS